MRLEKFHKIVADGNQDLHDKIGRKMDITRIKKEIEVLKTRI